LTIKKPALTNPTPSTIRSNFFRQCRHAGEAVINKAPITEAMSQTKYTSCVDMDSLEKA
jgi:hypothetical protein